MYLCIIKQSHKVDMPKSNKAIIWTPIVEWYGLSLDLRRDTKDICL